MLTRYRNKRDFTLTTEPPGKPGTRVQRSTRPNPTPHLDEGSETAGFGFELATLVDTPPTSDDWLHEIKFDGYRIMARVASGVVTLLTRGGKEWTARFPTLVDALAKLPAQSLTLDGELVALDERGRSNFQLLQNSMDGQCHSALVYYAFDLLRLDEEILVTLPLSERKVRLAALLASPPREKRKGHPHNSATSVVRLSEHVVGNGQVFFEQACTAGLEGIVSKLARSAYRAGRGHDWVKVKCSLRQEFVIVGYTEPAGSRSHLGALLLGVHERQGLRYCGRVGTGFDARSLRDLKRRLTPIEQPQPAVVGAPTGVRARQVHWVKPQLVAEVSFTGFTSGGLLRHPSFQGLREDKPADEVRLESPQ
jgi:bifunctional non-homologous end joining protein LigD